MTTELGDQKRRIRDQARAKRAEQKNRAALSDNILTRFMALPEYAAAHTVLFYVDIRTEVRTRVALASALESAKRIAVPFCVEDRLELFQLQSMGELETGRYQILEPASDLRHLADRRIRPRELDLIMVPGLAFDAGGGRIGYGQGFYDGLLAEARPDSEFVALAFECQIFPAIPVGPSDIHMNQIVTESRVLRCR